MIHNNYLCRISRFRRCFLDNSNFRDNTVPENGNHSELGMGVEALAESNANIMSLVAEYVNRTRNHLARTQALFKICAKYPKAKLLLANSILIIKAYLFLKVVNYLDLVKFCKLWTLHELLTFLELESLNIWTSSHWKS